MKSVARSDPSGFAIGRRVDVSGCTCSCQTAAAPKVASEIHGDSFVILRDEAYVPRKNAKEGPGARTV